MNLFDVLKRDHRALLDLLRRAGRTSGRARTARTQLLSQARVAFDDLAQAKERELLPALRSHCSDGGESVQWRLVGSSDELAQARQFFDELRETDPADRRWIVRLSLLEEHLERHIAMDQRELYPLAKRIGPTESTLDRRAHGALEAGVPVTPRAARKPVPSLWV